MAEITASLVKELRERTGAGMMDCKKALNETQGDIEKAIDFLREKGLAAAAKKAGRVAAEGVVESYIHMGGKIGVMVELNCETDFVAKTDEFKELAHDIAMHIAAAKPRYIRRDEVPAEEIAREQEIMRAQALEEGKPEKMLDRILEGRTNKFFAEICVLEQAFVKDPDVTIEQLITQRVSKIGEKIDLRRFARFEMGEGLEKRSDNFAEEVMGQMQV